MIKIGNYTPGLFLVLGASLGSIYGKTGQGASLGLLVGVIIYALFRRKR